MFQSCLTFRVWRGIRLEIASRCCFENSISIPGMAVTGQLAAAVCLGMHCLDVVKQECRLTTYVACMACRSFSWICWHVHVISLYPASFRSSLHSWTWIWKEIQNVSASSQKDQKDALGPRAKESPELPIALWEIQFVLTVFWSHTWSERCVIADPLTWAILSPASPRPQKTPKKSSTNYHCSRRGHPRRFALKKDKLFHFRCCCKNLRWQTSQRWDQWTLVKNHARNLSERQKEVLVPACWSACWSHHFCWRSSEVRNWSTVAKSWQMRSALQKHDA